MSESHLSPRVPARPLAGFSGRPDSHAGTPSLVELDAGLGGLGHQLRIRRVSEGRIASPTDHIPCADSPLPPNVCLQQHAPLPDVGNLDCKLAPVEDHRIRVPGDSDLASPGRNAVRVLPTPQRRGSVERSAVLPNYGWTFVVAHASRPCRSQGLGLSKRSRPLIVVEEMRCIAFR